MQALKQKQKSLLKHLDFIILDFICANIAYSLGYLIRFVSMPYSSGTSFSEDSFFVYNAYIIIFSLVQLLASDSLHAHKGILRRDSISEVKSVIRLEALTYSVTIFLLFICHESNTISRLVIFYMLILQTVFMCTSRILWKKHVIKSFERNESKQLAMFIISSKERFKTVVDNINHDIPRIYKVVGIALKDAEGLTEYNGIKIYPLDDKVSSIICHTWVDAVYIDLPGGDEIPKRVFKVCDEMNIAVYTVLSVSDVENKRIGVSRVGGKKVIVTTYETISYRQAFFKRILDIIFGFFGTVAAVLIILFIGPIIYIQSPGPIIFRQTRVGRNGKKFTFYKLRSMYPDAEERKASLMEQNKVSSDLFFKLDFDPRVIGNRILPDGRKKTGIGNFIRKTSLDEFPQFFNVLKGDMSIVGTRPPTLDEWEKYSFSHRSRLVLKPGITGMWQVSGRSNILDFDEVVKLDVKYIRNYSLGLDCRLVWETVKKVIKREGAA